MLKPDPSSLPLSPRLNVMIDSGAYSAWSQKKTINLKGYCDWLHKNMDWIGCYVNLDVISTGDPEAGAKQGFENFLFMRKQGLEPMPVFHYGEDMSWLDRMLDAGAQYIGFGGLVPVATNNKIEWLDLIWSKLVTSKGEATVKAHAFGQGGLDIIRRYPWYSSDNSTFTFAGRSRRVIFDSDTKINCRKDWLNCEGINVNSLSPLEVKEITTKLSKLGMTFEAVNYSGKLDYIVYAYIYAKHLLQVQDELTKTPSKFHATGFFNSPNARPAITEKGFKLYLVPGNSASYYAIILALLPCNILSSYYFLNTEKSVKTLRMLVLNPNERTNPSLMAAYNLLKEHVKCL